MWAVIPAGKRKSISQVVSDSISNFISHDVITGAAALAFYAALSLAPLVLFFVSIAGFLGIQAQDTIIREFSLLVGKQGGEAISMIIMSANESEEKGFIGTLISLIVLLFSASGVFAQLQSVLNRIFNVQAKEGLGIITWLRSRIFSIGILFALGFSMLVSLIASAGLTLVSSGSQNTFWIVFNFIISIGVFSLFFALVYKYLPDVKIFWRDVWLAAILTAVLFSVGKHGIGLYLGSSAVGSAYGAAGSLIILLIWVYYSSIIIFFGAELSSSIANNFGRGVKPNKYAENIST